MFNGHKPSFNIDTNVQFLSDLTQQCDGLGLAWLNFSPGELPFLVDVWVLARPPSDAQDFSVMLNNGSHHIKCFHITVYQEFGWLILKRLKVGD